jgi:ParB family transcriptional regulator, chromosome partitioning protein
MNNKLGRGLEALIPSDKNEGANIAGITTISIDRIHPNPYQPRINFDDEKLNELANSIAESGMIQPIIVTKKDDLDYELIAGERRLTAAKIAGFSEVPVIIRCVSPQEQLQFALIENIQRENLNPVEESLAYKQLQDQFDLTHQEIAKLVGKDRVTVTNSVRLLKLADEVRERIMNSEISAGHGRVLLQLEKKDQLHIASLIAKHKYSVRETERLVKRELNSKEQPAENEVIAEDKKFLIKLSESFSKHYKIPVTVSKKSKGGAISFRYKNREELKSIVERLLPENQFEEE